MEKALPNQTLHLTRPARKSFRRSELTERAGQVSCVDYEAVGIVKSRCYIFSSESPCGTEKTASRGPGDGKESPGRCTEAANSWHGGRPLSTALRTPSGCTRLFGLRPSCRQPSPSSGYAASPLRSGHPSVTSNCHSGSTKLRADATGPSGFPHLGVVARASRATRDARCRPAYVGAVGAAGTGSLRQTVPSRSIAQQRTSSLRANATIACFLRVLPPCVRR